MVTRRVDTGSIRQREHRTVCNSVLLMRRIEEYIDSQFHEIYGSCRWDLDHCWSVPTPSLRLDSGLVEQGDKLCRGCVDGTWSHESTSPLIQIFVRLTVFSIGSKLPASDP